MALLPQFFELFGRPEWSLIEAHQASTHLSIGLLLGAIGFDVAAFLFPKKRLIWRDSAFWMQLAGFALLLVTFALGYFGNPFAGKTNELAQKTEWHKNFGLLTLGVFGVLCAWRVTRFRTWGRIEGGAFALVNALGLVVITLTGWMGGNIAE